MFRVLRFSASTTLADMSRAVRRTPARSIALMFPLGTPSQLAYPQRMEALGELLRQAGKRATIVGGDALLRASAVTVGLAAAVTLEDWRDAFAERAEGARPGRTARRREMGAALTLVPPVDREPPDSVLDEDDVLDVTPPEYVLEILEQYSHPSDRSLSWVRDSADKPATRSRPHGRASGSLAYETPDDEPLRTVSEQYEEHMTGTIRATSGLDISWPGLRWSSGAQLLAAEEAACLNGDGVSS